MSRGEPLYRQWNLLKTLQSFRFGIGTDELAERMACSKRQVQRDLKLLETVGFPISYEERDFGKRFWKMSSRFLEADQLAFSLTEVLSLYLSQQLLAPLAGTQFGDGLSRAIEKIKTMLPAKALGHFSDLPSTLMVKNMACHDYSGQDKEIGILNQAIFDCRVLKVRYHSASQDRTIETLFHSYGLVVFGTNLYCIGLLEEYGEVRTLKVSRFVGVELTGQSFRRPANFSLAAHTNGAFGIMTSGTYQTIRVRFTGWAATNVREHRWHASQQIIKDGQAGEDQLVAEFELTDTREFKRWLLGFGRYAVALTPAALANDIKAELCACCEAYKSACPDAEGAKT
jgi:predicted DNA-binding transcriptional regulator YafY